MQVFNHVSKPVTLVTFLCLRFVKIINEFEKYTWTSVRQYSTDLSLNIELTYPPEAPVSILDYCMPVLWCFWTNSLDMAILMPSGIWSVSIHAHAHTLYIVFRVFTIDIKTIQYTNLTA